MVKRTMDEMITYFNDTVSTMGISSKDKMALLGIITAIGYEYQKAADAIEKLRKENENISQNFEVLRQTNKIQGEKISIYESVLPKWIPVTERLPKARQRVLFFFRNHITKRPRISIGWYNGKQWDSPIATEYDVTHWMPLPEPPKEETDG